MRMISFARHSLLRSMADPARLDSFKLRFHYQAFYGQKI